MANMRKKSYLNAIIALILALCITQFLGIYTVYAEDTNLDETVEKALVLYAPNDVVVDLYGGFPAKSKVLHRFRFVIVLIIYLPVQMKQESGYTAKKWSQKAGISY